jgi:hypothetical protein
MFESFETYQPNLTKEELIKYLSSWQQRGYRVLQGRPMIKNGWSVEFGGDAWIGVCPDDNPTHKGYWKVGYSAGFLRGTCGTMEELQTKFEALAKQFGIHTKSRPSQHHTSHEQPLTTWIKLNSMIGSSTIEAIYDPYLENKALANLLGLWQFGTRFSSSLRLLTTEKSKPSKNWIDKFNTEMKLHAQCKVYTGSSHPRLIFLDDKRCLTPDFSLSKEQDGTINTAEYSPKIKLFNKLWGQSADL